jgi:hypothetical protein
MVTQQLHRGWCKSFSTHHVGCVQEFTLAGITYTCECECHNNNMEGK